MSGTSTEAADFTPATDGQLTTGAVLLLAVQPAAGLTPALGYTATLQQIGQAGGSGLTPAELEAVWAQEPISGGEW
jgi:hypothetical protein